MNLTHPMVSSVSAGPSTVVMAQHHDEENSSERVAVVNADRGDHDASSLKRDPAVVAVRKPRQRSSITSTGCRPTLLMATGYHQHAKSMGECKDPAHRDAPIFPPSSPGPAGARRFATTTTKRGSLTKPMTATMMMRQPRMRVVRTGGGGRRRRSLTEEEVMQIKHAAGHGGGGDDAGSVVSERTYPLVQSRLSASGKQLETATELVASQEELATAEAGAAAAAAAAVAEKEEQQQEKQQGQEREEAQINDDNDRWNNGISAHEASFFTVPRPPIVPPRPEHRNSDEMPLCLDVLRQFRRISISEETDVSALTDSFYFPSVSEFDDCSFVSSNRSLGTSTSFHFSMGGRSVSRNLQSATSLSEESTVVFECSNNDVYSIAQDSILEDDSFAVPDSPAARTEESEFLHKSQEQLDLPIPEEEDDDDNDDDSTVDVADDILEQSGETKLSNTLASNTSRDVQPKAPSRTLPRQEEPFRCRTLPRQNDRIQQVCIDQCDESTVALDLENDNYSTLLDRDQEEEEEEEESSAWCEDQVQLCPGKRVSHQFEQSFAYGSNENIPTFQ